MSISSVPVGNMRRLEGTFANSAGAATDPTGAITLTVRTPAGVSTAYTFALAQLTKSGTGIYYRDVLLATAGTWYYQFKADMDNDLTTDVQDWAQINVESSPI